MVAVEKMPGSRAASCLDAITAIAAGLDDLRFYYARYASLRFLLLLPGHPSASTWLEAQRRFLSLKAGLADSTQGRRLWRRCLRYALASPSFNCPLNITIPHIPDRNPRRQDLASERLHLRQLLLPLVRPPPPHLSATDHSMIAAANQQYSRITCTTCTLKNSLSSSPYGTPLVRPLPRAAPLRRALTAAPAGQEEFDRLRSLSYAETHVVMVCFSVDNPISLENVESKVRPSGRPALTPVLRRRPLTVDQ
jgi:hypothetical protein